MARIRILAALAVLACSCLLTGCSAKKDEGALAYKGPGPSKAGAPSAAPGGSPAGTTR